MSLADSSFPLSPTFPALWLAPSMGSTLPASFWWRRRPGFQPSGPASLAISVSFVQHNFPRWSVAELLLLRFGRMSSLRNRAAQLEISPSLVRDWFLIAGISRVCYHTVCVERCDCLRVDLPIGAARHCDAARADERLALANLIPSRGVLEGFSLPPQNLQDRPICFVNESRIGRPGLPGGATVQACPFQCHPSLRRGESSQDGSTLAES